MNKIILAVVVIVLIGGGLYYLSKHYATPQQMQPMPTQMQQQAASPSTQSAQPTGNMISIKNFVFSPATLTVKVGDKVTWTNEDSVGHSATADNGSFDTGVLAQGQSGSVTFSKAGTYTYHCSVHPMMKATIVVE